MAAFADYYQVSPNPISLIPKIEKLKYTAVNHLADRQYIRFTPGDGLDGSDSSEAITTEATELSNAANQNALLHFYESAMDFLGLQETVNPTLLGDEQVVAAALYGPSIGVDHGEQPVYTRTKSSGREGKTCSNGNHLLYHTLGNGSAMEVLQVKKDRKTDPYNSKSVFETNVPVPLKKSDSDICKSWPSSSASGDREEKTNPELEVIRSEHREFLSNIVTKKQKADSRKDYIHVRARRGQATDRHSLAERVRRRKLNDRMNTLQNIVPGCNQITNKALVLEEIINYVQLLQKEVEVLSMKLASIGPIWTFDHQITGHPFKE